MKAKQQTESGNALIYVLIAIVLFAALSLTLGRQTDTGEAGTVSDEKAELYATQLINYAAQAKSAIDQMVFAGNADTIDNLAFTLPTGAGFNTAPHIYKVYHPEGGGLNPGNIAQEAQKQVSTDPAAGWYMGRFNNIDWTKTSAQDVVLVAYQINKRICELINQKVNGSTNIPQLTGSIRDVMIDDDLHGGTNADLTTNTPGGICPACKNAATLCVKSNSAEEYGFYTLVADQ